MLFGVGQSHLHRCDVRKEMICSTWKIHPGAPGLVVIGQGHGRLEDIPVHMVSTWRTGHVEQKKAKKQVEMNKNFLV